MFCEFLKSFSSCASPTFHEKTKTTKHQIGTKKSFGRKIFTATNEKCMKEISSRPKKRRIRCKASCFGCHRSTKSNACSIRQSKCCKSFDICSGRTAHHACHGHGCRCLPSFTKSCRIRSVIPFEKSSMPEIFSVKK